MEDPTPFGTALHERVRDEHPDLDRLVRESVSAGTRIRRHHRIGVAVAATTVAAVATGGAWLAGSGGTTRGEPDFATQPTASSVSSSAASARADQQAEARRQARREAEAQIRAMHALRDAPVYVDSPDWRCDQPADEKFTCSQEGATVVVTWRPADYRPGFLDPGKADVLDDVHTWVSEAHGEFFATVTPTPGTTQAQVDDVGRSLIWAD
ncbi:hypothetical protein [Nocardioides sp.]|uniref:hypothetical protein n=1 Tax=Nocardioides sp. TaxID=35761 RepID=UPI002ED7BD59